MGKARVLPLIVLLAMTAACAVDQATAPKSAPELSPTPAQVKAYIDNANRVVTAAEAYILAHSGPGAPLEGLSREAMQARLDGLRLMAAEQRRLRSEAEAFAAGRGPAPDMLSTPAEARRDDGILDLIDEEHTFSELHLDAQRGDAYAFTHTLFPVQIKQHQVGTVTVGSEDWTIDHEEGTGTFFSTGYYGQFYIDTVDCIYDSSHGQITTTHTAEATIFGLGFHFQTYPTYARASCDPQHIPCYQMPGLTGGGGIIPPGGVDNYPTYSESYDPYGETGTPDDGTCDASAGGSGADGDVTGSGIQFHPGDSTGGETVSWSTGQGNGGSSACGGAAVVEYACIEEWTSAGWETWGCGYITTC